MLLHAQRIDETVIRKLLGWRHSGFSLHSAVRIGAADTYGRRTVAESNGCVLQILEFLEEPTPSGVVRGRGRLCRPQVKVPFSPIEQPSSRKPPEDRFHL